MLLILHLFFKKIIHWLLLAFLKIDGNRVFASFFVISFVVVGFVGSKQEHFALLLENAKIIRYHDATTIVILSW